MYPLLFSGDVTLLKKLELARKRTLCKDKTMMIMMMMMMMMMMM